MHRPSEAHSNCSPSDLPAGGNIFSVFLPDKLSWLNCRSLSSWFPALSTYLVSFSFVSLQRGFFSVALGTIIARDFDTLTRMSSQMSFQSVGASEILLTRLTQVILPYTGLVSIYFVSLQRGFFSVALGTIIALNCLARMSSQMSRQSVGGSK